MDDEQSDQPSTSASRTQETRVPTGNLSGVTTTAAQVSASVSPKAQKVVTQSDSKSAPSGGRKRKSEPAVTAGNGSPDVATSGDFTAAMTMIASLPLSDAEKAEAVRRLLVSHGT